MPDGLPEYEVFAVRYAFREARRSDHFIGGDPHDGPMPMDYFVWAIRGAGRTVVVDCGFTAEVGAPRGRTVLRRPSEGLAALGIDAATVPELVLTHLHYDHVGTLAQFPAATIHLQEPDLHFAVGRHIRHKHVQRSFEVEDVVGVIRANYAGRVRLHNGEVALAPGITLFPAPGHSAGLQCVQVNTRRGMVVLASDASHFYETIETNRPFPVVVSVPDTLDSYERVRARADSPQHIVPGHDPLVMQRYPAVSPELEGIAVRLDVPPSA